MSILPFAPLQPRAAELLASPSAQEAKVAAAAKGEVGVATSSKAEVAAEAHAFSLAARASHRSDAEPLTFQRQGDPRLAVRHAYRLGRMRKQHAAFEQLWKEGDVSRRAELLIEEAKRVDGDVYGAAQRQRRDAFDSYLALLEAREHLAHDDAVAQKALDDALQRAWDAGQDEIMSGFNTAKVLMEFAGNVEAWNQVRRLYGELMFQDASLGSIFKQLLERFGPRRLSDAIKSLRGAIAADLASPLVHSDRIRLVNSQLDLETTRKMSSLVADGDVLCRQVHGDKSTADQVMRFVGAVLDYVSLTSGADKQFAALCELLAPMDAASPLVRHLVREFLRLRIPMSLWRSLEVREYLFPSMYRRR